MPKIFDCFTFFNELDLLELRLHELEPVIHRFVLAEAPFNHRGAPKPLYFWENRSRFARFLDRIEHVVVEDMPLGGTSESDHWRRENHQRNALARGLTGAGGDDFILLSDLDEIPKAEAVKRAANTVSDWATIHAFEMRMFWYFLNLEHPEKWVNSRMTKRRYIPTLQTLRIYNYPWKDPRGLLKRWSKMFRTWHRPIRWEVHRNSGWHFTFMNGADAVRAKLLSYAHVSSEKFAEHESVTERIALALASSLRPDDPYSYKLRKIDKNFPSYLRANLDKFRHMIADDSILSL